MVVDFRHASPFANVEIDAPGKVGGESSPAWIGLVPVHGIASFARGWDDCLQQRVTKPTSATDLIAAVCRSICAEEPIVTDAEQQQADVGSLGLRILLAEDSEVNQEVAVGLLELAGHSVDVVTNGKEALEAVAIADYHVVLMDIEMPEMDGLQATREIRAKEVMSGEHLPIIAMTAHAVKGFEEQCAQAGMDAYITKPICSETLFDAVTRCARHDLAPSVR